MEITCEFCGNSNWKMRTDSVVTAIECQSCGTIYPLSAAGRWTQERLKKRFEKEDRPN